MNLEIPPHHWTIDQEVFERETDRAAGKTALERAMVEETQVHILTAGTARPKARLGSAATAQWFYKASGRIIGLREPEDSPSYSASIVVPHSGVRAEYGIIEVRFREGYLDDPSDWPENPNMATSVQRQNEVFPHSRLEERGDLEVIRSTHVVVGGLGDRAVVGAVPEA